MADYLIDINALNSKKSEFEALVRNTENIYNSFNSSYLKRLSGTEISNLAKKVSDPLERLKKGYNNSNTWLNNYITGVKEVENKLASFSGDVANITTFSGSFQDIFGKVTIPVLKTGGEPLANYVGFGGATVEYAGQIEIGEGGKFVIDSKKGMYGYIISSIDGKRHVVFRQSQISGWATNCNRAAAASIASAFTSNPWDAVNVAKKSRGGIGYNNKVTNNYFNQFGLSANVRHVNGSYDSIKNELVNTLKNGNYVMFDLSRSNVRGKSGQKWTSTRHWLSIIDIKKTGNGPNDYAIFVSDSGHKGSTTNHGLGTGWYSINEFSGQKIANFTTITNTKRKT